MLLVEGITLFVSGAGLVTGLYAFRTVRTSPLRRPIAALVLLFSGFALDALFRLAFPVVLDLNVLRAITYTVVTGFVLLLVYFQVEVNAGVSR